MTFYSRIKGFFEKKESKYEFYNIKPDDKTLNVLILGGGPIGLFAGYKLLKKGNNVTIFEKRKQYTRHNMITLQENKALDAISIIPSEITKEITKIPRYTTLSKAKSSDNINYNSLISSYKGFNKGQCDKETIKNKPYFMVPSKIFYIVISDLEEALEKHFKQNGGSIIRPINQDAYQNIHIINNLIKYTENGNENKIDITKYDIILINDGANSYFREIFFKKTNYVENPQDNIFYYGLNENNDFTITNNRDEVKPFAYGLLLTYEIENKQEFKQKFNTDEKLKQKNDFNTVLELENKDNRFLNGMTVKEILIENKRDYVGVTKPQYLFSIHMNDSYLYISIMVNPKDVEGAEIKDKIKYNELTKNLQTYLMFALYYYDLSELIDLNSARNQYKLFPLKFSSVKQTCSFVKSGGQYQLMAMLGDAMVSGNFHSGVVLNRNLMAVDNMCILIDKYIDSYPTLNNVLDINFLRQMFFHGNLSNQEAINYIIKKSKDSLINYTEIDREDFNFKLNDIIKELGDIILCKNCVSKDKLLCRNSQRFLQYIINNIHDEVLQRIIKYLLLPDKFKYNNVIDRSSNTDRDDDIFH